MSKTKWYMLSVSHLSDRDPTSSSGQRHVSFLKSAADTTLDQKASIVDETSGITRTHMKEFPEAFRLFDKDGDSTITKEELRRVMRSLGQFARAEELSDMLQEVDDDGDGKVSVEEIASIQTMSGTRFNNSAESFAEQEYRELRESFSAFDKHNRGYICASDLRAVLKCLGGDLSEYEIEDIIKEVDLDGHGRINFLVEDIIKEVDLDGHGRINFLEFVSTLGESEDAEDACHDEDDPNDAELSLPLPISAD